MGISVPQFSISASDQFPLRRMAPVMSSGKAWRKSPSRMRMSPSRRPVLRVENAATGLASGVVHAQQDFARTAEFLAVIPGLGSVDFGVMAARAFVLRLKRLHFVGGIEIKNALAGIADDGLLPGAHVIVSLRPQHDLAGHAFVIANLGDATAAKFRHALVVAQKIFVDSGAHLIALAAPLSQAAFRLRQYAGGLSFFFFDLGGFGFHFGLSCFHFLVADLGVDHQFQNFVFGGGNFFFRKLDFVQQGFILVVGLYVERLVAILRDLSAQVGDGSVVFAAGGFVGLDGGLSVLQLSFGARQLLFDHGYALGEFGNFILQAADFFIRILQAQ